MGGNDLYVFPGVAFLFISSILFHVQSIRLTSFLHKDGLPSNHFIITHSILFFFDGIGTVGLGFLLYSIFSEVPVKRNTELIRFICLVLICSLLELYAIIASLLLRKYLKKIHQETQSQWLEELGKGTQNT